MSKYSASAESKTNQRPKFYTVRDLLMLTPPLNDLGISPTEALTKVNEFEVKEISYDLGTIKYDDDSGKAKVQLSLWYMSGKSPVIVEFDVDVDANESTHEVSKKLEEFPSSLIIGIYEFYMALQNEDIVDRTSPKTKTDYAYEFRKK
jgi:hypothetical protein